MSDQDRTSRRDFMLTGALAASGFALITDQIFAQGALEPTPACHDGDQPTLRQTEGPYFTPRSPERASLVGPGMGGRAIELSGFVLTRACKPVARALLDFWQADAKGEYDNRGFRLRGHQFSDDQGRYRLKTIVPAQYPGRTPHIHVKVQAPGGPVLTTQLYFPDQPGNRGDGLFRPELVLRIAPAGEGLAGRFDFVLDLS
jgi:protocatechuate 3,4-dioxygenase beta subunit